MQNIALLGGAFDPVHLGHIAIAEAVLQQTNTDEVWFVPTVMHPDKDETMFTIEERIAFLQAVIAENPRFRLNDQHLRDTKKNYTIYLIQSLQTKHPEVKFSFIIGADNVIKLQHWHKAELLLNRIDFIVINRNTSDRDSWKDLFYFHKLHFIDMPAVYISSSDIREKIQNKEDISGLVPDMVFRKISEKP